MALAFLATIAAQMGSAWFNSSRNKSHSKKMAELQRVYEEKATIEGIENARTEFAELCAFQREIEEQTHKDRLELIKTNHEQALYQFAYERSLNKWPLLVPPYVIANAPLTIGANKEQCIPLNCILTTSDNLNFNRHVFPRIEEQIAVFCCKYWNASSKKSIRFFQEAWKDTTKDVGPLHKDIYAHLKSVPTLLISPILKHETILFRFYWWGLSLDPTDAHVDEFNELNPELSISIPSDTKFDGEISNIIVKECVPKLQAFISFFADMYYWNFYKLAPNLPHLLSRNQISLPLSDISLYKNEYTRQLSDFCDGTASISLSPLKKSKYLYSLVGFTNSTDYDTFIQRYITKRKELECLDCRELEVLEAISTAEELSASLRNLLVDTINEIKDNEVIGFLPCIGRNDVIQTLLNKAVELSAESVNISPINIHVSIVEFRDIDTKQIKVSEGYRDYLLLHPLYVIDDNCRFDVSSYSFNKVNIEQPVFNGDSILPELGTICHEHTCFIENLKKTYGNLNEKFWKGEIELLDIRYENLILILKHLLKKVDYADYGIIAIGYSVKSDNYYYAISLIYNNCEVGDSFVCKSNSLDKKIRKKLNNKSILKIKIK